MDRARILLLYYITFVGYFSSFLLRKSLPDTPYVTSRAQYRSIFGEDPTPGDLACGIRAIRPEVPSRARADSRRYTGRRRSRRRVADRWTPPTTTTDSRHESERPRSRRRDADGGRAHMADLRRDIPHRRSGGRSRSRYRRSRRGRTSRPHHRTDSRHRRRCTERHSRPGRSTRPNRLIEPRSDKQGRGERMLVKRTLLGGSDIGFRGVNPIWNRLLKMGRADYS